MVVETSIRVLPAQIELQTAPSALTEAEAVAYLRRAGVRTCQRRGRWWYEYRPWYFTPVELLAPVPDHQIARPHWRAMGYRAISADPASTIGRTPAVMIEDLPTYDAGRLSRDRRREVRRALENFEFEVLDSARLLVEQGWAVASRAAAESGHVLPRTRRAYLHQVRAIFDGPGPTVVAARSGDRLVAYMTSFAVGGTVALEHLFIDPSARRPHAGVGLYWLTLRLWARSPGVSAAFLGLTFPERPGLDPFKRSLGAHVAFLPSLTRLVAPVRWWLAATRRTAHERQTLSELG